MTYNEIIDKAYQTFGEAERKNKAGEECLELALALVHERDGKASAWDVIGEIADVQIMLWCLMRIYGIDAVRKRIEEKKQRLEALLNV